MTFRTGVVLMTLLLGAAGCAAITGVSDRPAFARGGVARLRAAGWVDKFGSAF